MQQPDFNNQKFLPTKPQSQLAAPVIDLCGDSRLGCPQYPKGKRFDDGPTP
jgi:hypothetical protein